MLGTTVPVTAVDEDGDLSPTEHHICRSTQVRNGSGGHSVSESLSVHKPTDQSLGLRVTATDRLHVASARR